MKMRKVFALAACVVAASLTSASADTLIDVSVPGVYDVGNGGKVAETSAIVHGGVGYMSFLEYQNDTSEAGVTIDPESGGHVLDNKSGGQTHAITLADLKLTTDGQYYAFVFDADQNNKGDGSPGDITVTDIRIYASTTNLNGLEDTTFVPDVLTYLNTNVGPAKWSLGAFDLQVDGGDKGSGFADMFLYVPFAALEGFADPATTHIYFYSESIPAAGSSLAYPPDDGGEHWGTAERVPPPNGVPLPTTALAALPLFGGVAFSGMRKRRTA